MTLAGGKVTLAGSNSRGFCADGTEAKGHRASSRLSVFPSPRERAGDVLCPRGLGGEKSRPHTSATSREAQFPSAATRVPAASVLQAFSGCGAKRRLREDSTRLCLVRKIPRQRNLAPGSTPW